MKNLVSIIIPVFKNSYFLNDSLSSAINQTYKNIEIIVVNDGSPEKERIHKIVKKFKKKSNIRLINLRNNKGVGYALNMGIKNSNGTYISWLSHDDYLHNAKIKKQIFALKKSKKEICFSNFIQVDHFKNKIKTIKISKNLFEPKHSILVRDNFNFCSALLRKNIFKKVGYFDVKKKHTQDYNMMFRIFNIYKPIILSEFLFFSRTHVKQNSKLFREEAVLEKEAMYLSKFKEMKFIFLKSNLFKKIYITFFLRDKDLKKITYNLIKLIKAQTGILYLILRTVILLNEILLFIKRR